MILLHSFFCTLNGLSSGWFPSPLSFRTFIKKSCFLLPSRNPLFLLFQTSAGMLQSSRTSKVPLTYLLSLQTSALIPLMVQGNHPHIPTVCIYQCIHNCPRIFDSSMEPNLHTINGQVALLYSSFVTEPITPPETSYREFLNNPHKPWMHIYSSTFHWLYIFKRIPFISALYPYKQSTTKETYVKHTFSSSVRPLHITRGVPHCNCPSHFPRVIHIYSITPPPTPI